MIGFNQLDCEIQPSKFFIKLLLCISCAAVALILLTDLAFWLKSLLVISVGAVASYEGRCEWQAFNRVTRLVLDSRTSQFTFYENAIKQSVNSVNYCTLLPFMLAMQVTCPRKKHRWIVLFRDAIPSADFRRLTVILKHYRGE